jgi:hypothetical protein
MSASHEVEADRLVSYFEALAGSDPDAWEQSWLLARLWRRMLPSATEQSASAFSTLCTSIAAAGDTGTGFEELERGVRSWATSKSQPHDDPGSA